MKPFREKLVMQESDPLFFFLEIFRLAVHFFPVDESVHGVFYIQFAFWKEMYPIYLYVPTVLPEHTTNKKMNYMQR
jgi:hypothetical protein